VLRGLVFAVVLVVELLLLLPPKGVLGKCSILSIRWKLADRPVASGPALWVTISVRASAQTSPWTRANEMEEDNFEHLSLLDLLQQDFPAVGPRLVLYQVCQILRRSLPFLLQE
jgi:hypothetical protein